MQIRIFIRQSFPLDLRPHHERIHRTPDSLLLLFPLRMSPSSATSIVAQMVMLKSVVTSHEGVDTALYPHQAGVVVGVVAEPAGRVHPPVVVHPSGC